MRYWSETQLEANILIFFNIVGALLLGMVIGYERSYHGRAAGVRTYGMVCMASAALVVVLEFPKNWFGGLVGLGPMADPTRIVQGIVTGIGFLGAGVIMKEGLNISGLSTAASIWASSVIGILCGSGFYLAAIMMTLLSSLSMVWGGKLEKLLPSRHAVAVSLTFAVDYWPTEEDVREFAAALGYRVAEGSTVINSENQHQVWHLVFLAASNRPVSIPILAAGIRRHPSIAAYRVAFARN